MDREPLDYGALDRSRHCNYWDWDPTLRYEARRVYPDDEVDWAESVLDEFGATVGHEIADDSDTVDRHGPELHTHDRDGAVVNEVEYHPAQFDNERRVYEDARLTHDAFHAPPAREEPVGLLHPLTMQALLCYADVGLTCAASMTVGAAVVLDKFDDGSLSETLAGLTSAGGDDHVEGAMFLTERHGGSDVGAIETRAEPQPDGTYALTGEKWFCSNIDAQGALVLARTPDAPDGTAGLSLFLVPRELPDGSLNDARFRRLKDKLGTLSVPTGEIEYDGATGYLVGEEARGFRYMTEMLNYERVTNATGAIGVMGRSLLAAKAYAADREAFGSPIEEYPLLRRDLSALTVTYEAAAAFAFEAAKWYDRRERAWPDDDGQAFKLMRLLVPVAKYKTAALAVEFASEAMEVLGGNGYVNDRVTQRLLRDAQVLPIWEGTSNILSLDVLRALDRADAHEALLPFIRRRLDGVEHDLLADAAETVEAEFEDLQSALARLATADADTAQYHAKRLADRIYDVVAATLLCVEGQREIERADDARKALVARRFVTTRFDGGETAGIGADATPGDDYFDVLARYGSVTPATLEERLSADGD